jgi:hypothetical protein
MVRSNLEDGLVVKYMNELLMFVGVAPAILVRHKAKRINLGESIVNLKQLDRLITHTCQAAIVEARANII